MGEPRVGLALAIGAALAPMLGAAAADPAPGFAPLVQKILARNCTACHNSADHQAGLNLEPDHAYANLVGVASTESPLKRVAPGQPEQSYLYRKLTGGQIDAGGQGAQMPLNGAALPAAQIETIRQWIAGGARKGP